MPAKSSSKESATRVARPARKKSPKNKKGSQQLRFEAKRDLVGERVPIIADPWGPMVPFSNKKLKVGRLPFNTRSDELTVQDIGAASDSASVDAGVSALQKGTNIEAPAIVGLANLLPLGAEHFLPAAADMRTAAFDGLGPDLAHVADPKLHPWSAHVRITMERHLPGKAPEQFIGSGWVIGNNTIITAGHCVYDKVKLQNFRVSLGGVNSGLPQNIPFVHADTTLGWINGATAEAREAADIGVIRVDFPLANYVTPLPFAAYNDPTLNYISTQRLALSVAGFPLDPWNSFLVDAGVLLQINNFHLYYNIVTLRGQSGAPVLFWDANRQPIVVGIHHWDSGALGNRAVRISPAVASLLQIWKA